jgi:3-hydroxyisobutyrate dehydrogenase
VIGLGNIGSGVALCLARAKVLSAVHDVKAQIAGGLEGVPPNSASPAEVARNCEVVLIAVYDAAQVREVLEGPSGALSAARPELTIVLLSTVRMPELREFVAMAAAKNVVLLDCGVTGGMAAARGGLVSMIGGERAAVEHVRPVLEMFSRKVAHMGSSGSGMAAKIARNVIVYATWRAEHEGVVLAKAAGVNIRQLIDVIEESQAGMGMGGVCFWARRDAANGIEAVDENFRIYGAAVLEKDLDAALQLANELGVRLPSAEISRETGRVMAGLAADTGSR